MVLVIWLVEGPDRRQVGAGRSRWLQGEGGRGPSVGPFSPTNRALTWYMSTHEHACSNEG